MGDIYRSESGRRAIEAQYRRALDKWPVPHEETVLPTCQGETFVIASGDRSAPPLVLFHGSGTNSAAWIRDVAVWARDYRVYAVDMIGEPGLSASSRPPLTSDAYAAWLDDVWRGLSLVKACVVGMSLGGWLGLDYAIRRAERVAALSLLAPSGVGRQKRLTMLKLAAFRIYGTRGLQRSLRLISGRRDDLPRPVIDALLVIFQNFKPRLDRIPLRSDTELARLRMPIQVIVGGRDVLLRSSETRERIERCVPHARVTFLPDVGHILPPQTTTVAEFLRVVTAAGLAADPPLTRDRVKQIRAR